MLLIVTAGSAAADNWGSPMTFRIGQWGGWFDSDPGIKAIFADGDFVSSTADDFEIFLATNPVEPGTFVTLNSRGGNVLAGMLLGTMIRERTCEYGGRRRDHPRQTWCTAHR